MTNRQLIQTQVERLFDELNEGDPIMWLQGKHLKHSKVKSKVHLNHKLCYEVLNGKLVLHEDILKYSAVHERRTL